MRVTLRCALALVAVAVSGCVGDAERGPVRVSGDIVAIYDPFSIGIELRIEDPEGERDKVRDIWINPFAVLRPGLDGPDDLGGLVYDESGRRVRAGEDVTMGNHTYRIDFNLTANQKFDVTAADIEFYEVAFHFDYWDEGARWTVSYDLPCRTPTLELVRSRACDTISEHRWSTRQREPP